MSYIKSRWRWLWIIIRFNQSKFSSKGVTISEEEKIKIALDLAKQGIDLEEIENTMNNIYEYIKPLLDLAEKNKRIIDKYIKDKE